MIAPENGPFAVDLDWDAVGKDGWTDWMEFALEDDDVASDVNGIALGMEELAGGWGMVFLGSCSILHMALCWLSLAIA